MELISKNKKRRLKREQAFRESLDIKRKDYFLCLADGQQLKVSEDIFERLKDLRLTIQTKTKICRQGLYAWKETFSVFVKSLYDKCTAWANLDSNQIMIRILREYQTPLLPNHVASKLQGCINMIMRKCG